MIPRKTGWLVGVFSLWFGLAGCGKNLPADDDTGTDDDSAIDDDDSADDDDDDDSAADDDDSAADDDDQAFGPYAGTYSGKEHGTGADCTTEEALFYYTPCDVDAGECAGTYPVLFWTQGTCMPHDAAVVHELLGRAAQRGFVAVSPQYYNGGHDGPPDGIAPSDWCVGNEETEFCDCDGYPLTYIGFSQLSAQRKTRCIFDEESPGSAINVICALPFADCAAVVTAGGSQGANIAVRAAEYGPVAVAAYALPIGWDDLHHDNRTWLADENLLEIHGGNDEVCTPSGNDGFVEFLGATIFDGQSNAELDCSDVCVEPSEGSFPACDCRVAAEPHFGWYLVGADELVDGDPDHAFVCHDHETEQYIGSCSSLDPGFLNPVDPGTEQPWSWPSALEFLMARARP